MNKNIKKVYKNEYIIILESLDNMKLKGIYYLSHNDRNILWKVKDSNNEIYYILYIKNKYAKNIFTKLSIESYNLLYNGSFSLYNFYYNRTTGFIFEKDRQKYLHQLIMNYCGKIEGDNMSIYHLNKDKLDNRLKNLKIGTRNENINNIYVKYNLQKINKNKIIPNIYKNNIYKNIDIDINTIPKYIIYNKYYFTIKSHPKLNSDWNSSKRNNISIFDKYDKTLNLLKEINNYSGKKFNNVSLSYPNNINIINDYINNIKYLYYTQCINNNFLTFKIKIDNNKSELENYSFFQSELKKQNINIPNLY